MEFNAGSLELPVCLDEVAGIRPKTRVVHCYHNVTGLSGEPGKPGHLLPSGRNVLAPVRVRSGNDEDIPIV